MYGELEYTTAEPGLTEGLQALFTTYFTIAMLISLSLTIISIIAMTQIFRKAGIAGWKAFVPFYNSYLLYKITFGNGWLFLLTLIPIVGYIAPLVLEFRLAKVFGKSTAFAVLSIFFSPITRLILGFGDCEYQKPIYY